MSKYVLAINPGSTSTKVAIYEGKKCAFEETIRHPHEEIQKFSTVFEQAAFRKDIVINMCDKCGVAPSEIIAVVGRGGMLYPLESGTYFVNDLMINDVKEAKRGEHASNLGCVIAREIANELNINAYIVDPVAVDEMDKLARVSGMVEFSRDSLFHALNQKAVAKRYAEENNLDYNKLNLIVAHLGGGISVGAHRLGKVIDVNNALDGDGPMSPERSGSVPVGKLYNAIYDGKYTKEEMVKLNYGRGGLFAHLGTTDGIEIVKRIEAGDEHAKLVFEAMAYQIAKEICSHGATLFGKIDAVIITGGLAYSKMLIDLITERVSFLGNIVIYPGEDEMQALVEGVYRVLDGKEAAKEYIGSKRIV